ncbi:hypothetical protein G6O69_20395 [Pseudenhygromyxa sp. WMMC2535]|uniref:hypothetical protein n=1 Tax=Pseudenhygromyxa sp. WMMC2535 TaxID=2712867 RepID=UPI00155659B9|nr:hypothetical protein [Pseudenhygromyxa sp. WMMC2535]NVB40214.1 hypothetical protein [Pseudenhygromyxa sp. WMMC2535]
MHTTAPTAPDLREPQSIDVLADWLEARGDPRGRALALARRLTLSAQAGEAPGALSDSLTSAQAEVERFVFDLEQALGGPERLAARWYMGLLLDATLLANEAELGELAAQRALAEALLTSEAAVALTALDLGELDPGAALPALVAGPLRPALRALTLGNYRASLEGLAEAGADLAARVPELRQLSLRGPGCALDSLLGPAALPALTQLHVDCELDPLPLRALASAPRPGLRRVELRLGGRRYFGLPRPEPAPRTLDALPTPRPKWAPWLAALLVGDTLPDCEQLALRSTDLVDAILDSLAAGALLPRLRVLDLRDSVLDEPALERLLGCLGALAGLERLDLGGCLIDSSARAQLSTAAAKLGVRVSLDPDSTRAQVRWDTANRQFRLPRG